MRDDAFAGLSVVYTFGPDFGRRVVTHADLGNLHMPPQGLRQAAHQHLEVLSSRAEFHGQPPALMLSFEGLESSLLLANDFWARLAAAVPGELVVGVPARDVVVVTGSQSGPGLEKAKRCVERVFFAGGDNLISRGLLVRRGGTWEPFDRSARPSGRPTFGPAHLHGVGQPPRQYQEHPSWPGQRIPPQPAGHRPGPGRPAPVRRRPMPGMPPAALDQTGSHNLGLDQTGSHRLDQTGSHRLDQTGSHRLGMTGSQPPVPPMMSPARAPEPTYRDYAAEVAEVAQYSAVPYSALPYSGAPYDSSAYAIAPQSMAPNALATSQLMAQAAYSSPDGFTAYTTGSIPRIRDYEPAGPTPSYPASWGSGPEISAPPARTQFPTGPRSRFA